MMMKYKIIFQKYLKNMTWNITRDKIPDITELDTF